MLIRTNHPHRFPFRTVLGRSVSEMKRIIHITVLYEISRPHLQSLPIVLRQLFFPEMSWGGSALQTIGRLRTYSVPWSQYPTFRTKPGFCRSRFPLLRPPGHINVLRYIEVIGRSFPMMFIIKIGNTYRQIFMIRHLGRCRIRS